jgi:hypothetical protein
MTRIGDQWVCAWSGDWLESRLTDEARATADLQTLDKVKQIHAWAYWDDPGRTIVLDAISKARLGDPEPMVNMRTLWAC